MSLSRKVNDLVDDLGAVQAHIQSLRSREAELKEAILVAAPTHDFIEGLHWDLELRTAAPVTTTQWKKVALALKPSRRLIEQHSQTSAPYTQFRLYGKE